MYSQTPITGMLNSYARVTAIAGNVLTVSNITGFSPNQEVLIYQTQDANIVTNPALGTFGQITAINSTGLFEIDTILSITGNTITLNSVALYHTYNSASALQIVSIPNYPSGAQLTGNITGTAWNGSIGGIITLRTPVLDLNGSCIVASGLGFRGGTVAGNMNTSNPIPNPNSAFTTIFGFGQKGESVTLDLGALNLESGTAPSANGGGAGGWANWGGGGGSNGGNGGVAGTAVNNQLGFHGLGGLGFPYSYSIAVNTGPRYFLGGGGGSGSQDSGNSTPGADGGGIVFLIIDTLLSNLSGSCITANGISAGLGIGSDGGGGGGGGGGVITFKSNNDTIPFFISDTSPISISATGGDGSAIDFLTYCHSPGGGGGGGVVSLPTTQFHDSLSILVCGGLAGQVINSDSCPLTTAAGTIHLGPTNGAQDGTCGVIIDSLNYESYGTAVTAYSLSNGHATDRDTICHGDSIHLRAIHKGATNILWTGPNGFNSNMQSLDILNLSITDSAYYTFSAQICGCWSRPDTVWIIIHYIKPNLGLDIPVCDTTQMVTVRDYSGYDHFTYEWYTPTYINTGNIDSIDIVPSINHCVIVVATDTIHGCSHSDTVCFIPSIPDTATVGIAQNCATGCYLPFGSITTNSLTNVYQFNFWGAGPPFQSDFNESVTSNTPFASSQLFWCYGTDWGVYDIAVSVAYGAGCIATDTITIYHYDFTNMAGVDTTLCPAPDSLVLGDPLLSTLPLGPFGQGYIITWTDLITSQVYNQANPLVDLHPGTTNVFQLHIITPDGCHFYDTISIITCCFADVGKSIQIIPANSVVNNSTVTQTHVWVQGDITIDGDVLWSNKFVRMAPHARIIIPPTYFLTPSGPSNYTRLMLEETQIFADCDTMWTGIQVYGDTTYYDSTWAGLVHRRNSIIREAEIGIHSIDAGSFIVQEANLLENHIHIVVAPFPNYFSNNNIIDHPSFLDGAILDCKNPLINPFAGERTYMGINVTKPSVNFIEHYTIVGVGTLPNYRPSIANTYNRNTIRNCDLGINANNASLFIENTDFFDITCNSTYTNPCVIPVINQRPTAIRFHGNGTDLIVKRSDFNNCNNGVNAIATSSTEIFDCQFIDIKDRGIIFESHQVGGETLDAYNNQFTNCQNGIYCYWNSDADISIRDNVMNDCNRSILVHLNRFSNVNSELNIHDNQITGGFIGIETFLNNLSSNMFIFDNQLDLTNLNGVMTRGISITEPDPNTRVIIRQNTIKARHLGIFLNGISNGLTASRVRFNSITMSTNIILAALGSVPMSNFGIYFNGTFNARALKNSITGPSLFGPNSTDWQNNMRGICINNTQNSQIFCNSVRDHRDALQGASSNTFSQLIRNVYFPGRSAVFIANGGSTSVQGTPTRSNDNEFQCQFTISALRSESGNGLLSSHYVRSTPTTVYSPSGCNNPSSFTPINHPSPWAIQIAYPTAGNGFATLPPLNSDWCNFINARVNAIEDEDMEFDSIPEVNSLLMVLDSMPWDSLDISESLKSLIQWQTEQQIYHLLHRYDTLTALSTRLDSFYQYADSIGYGKLRRAQELSLIEAYTESYEELEGIAPSDTLSTLYAYVILKTLQLQQGVKWDSLSSGSQDSLILIAEMCPEYYGSAVGLARAIVSVYTGEMLYSDCEIHVPDAFEVDSTFTPDSITGSCLTVYPNPCDDQVVLELKCKPENEYSIMIVNNQGQIMHQHIFEEFEGELVVNTSSWQQGAYHIILYHNGIYEESRVLAVFRY